MNRKTINFIFVVFFILPLTSQAVKKDSHPFPLNKALIKELKSRGSLLSDRVGNYILRAEDLAESQKYNKAIELLEYHYKRESFTKSEKAQFAMHLGHLYRQKDKKNEASLSYLKKALDTQALSYHQHLSTLYNMAQIHLEKGKYDKALELIKLWFSINENPAPEAYILLAYYYHAKKQLSEALKYVEKTFSLVNKPKESWLQFAVAIYLKQKKYKKAQPLLEKLTALYPSNSSHWKQLAGVYLHLNKNSHAFVTLDMAHKMGHLKTKHEYLNLSSLYLEYGLPYQGAKLLKEKMNQNIIPKKQKHLEFLSEALWLAREGKTSLEYLKEASKQATGPDFLIRYGHKLLDQEKWLEAEKVFKQTLNTKEMQRTIKEIENYKKTLLLKEKNILNKHFLSQMKRFKEKYEKHNSHKTHKKNSIKKSAKYDENKDHQKNDIHLLKAPPSTNNLENIYLYLGIALYQQKKYETALSYFKKSIEVDDSFLKGYEWIDYTEAALLEKKEKETLVSNN